ncbi:NirD/YgiW/YdeI family stress tolerance protein [Vibrio sp. S4M6]|uniref:YgiW/YdeI family stress tolerance OB fold protein n=1 Tax=Vibrio sinus TaxID=2946865 RepID=UPI00202A4B06|nr:NirD/YgiW/YdeI family stress tolerance protein [Vibrio sinus]MCL9783318.1 NirD/YgiW/YdeI family stress tolerance protein [Vibrio sinus]
MKKLLLLSAIAVASTSAMAATKDNQGGGFTGPSADPVITTAKAVKDASDDAAVQLTGYITQSLGDENYMFKDTTGQVQVDIDDDKWGGVNVTPETKVILKGEVDKDWTSRTVDVKRVMLADKPVKKAAAVY